jgi:hypothetical protein
VEEVAAAVGIILGLTGVLATVAIAVMQTGETVRQFKVLSATMIDSLAVNLSRFDEIDSATDLILERLQ